MIKQVLFRICTAILLFIFISPSVLALNITWISQSPSDLTSVNSISKHLNISYNVTDSHPIGAVTLYYNTSSGAEAIYYVNGNATVGWQHNVESMSNISYQWNFTLDENQFLPGTYNANETLMEATKHSNFTIDTTNELAFIQLLNISSSEQYSFFEFMGYKENTASTPLVIYYCNSSYSTGTPWTSTHCAQIYSLSSGTFNHSHSVYTSHFVVPMGISGGKLNGIKVTKRSSIILRPTSTNGWNISYINKFSRTGAIKTSVNGGATWTNQVYTVDAHIHQFSDSEMFRYFLNACNHLGVCFNSTVKYDLIQLGGLPPTAPDIIVPTNSSYNGTLNIQYTASVSPNGYAISYYNISLLDENATFIKSIEDNNGVNLLYDWIIDEGPGTYRIQVMACDSIGQCSSSISVRFTVTYTLNQALYSSLANNSVINISEIVGYTVDAWFISPNETSTKNITMRINGTYQDSGNVSNNTHLPLHITTINTSGSYRLTLTYPYDTMTLDFVVSSTNKTEIDAGIHCCERYNSVVFLLIFDILFYLLIFWLINNIRVDVDKVLERFGDGNKAVKALKVDIFMKSAFLFILAVFGLFIVGFLNWIVKGLGQPIEWLSNMLYIMNTIILFVLFVLLVIKAFYFPFGLVKSLGEDLADEMGKARNYRR